MHDRRWRATGGLLAGCALASAATANGEAARPGLGSRASAGLIRDMDRTVASDGTGLPTGSGTVAAGRAIYAAKCESCHGARGAGGAADALAGGRGTLTSPRPVKTIGSYWPYATTLFDYVRRAMPLTAPRSLADHEVYGLVAYLLSINGIIPANARLDRKSLPRVRMPNRDGFVSLEPQAFDGGVEHLVSEKIKEGRR